MGGNSHYGKSKGVNVETLNNYKKVLDSNEVDIIKKICRRVKRRNTFSKVVILRFNKNKREFI